MRHFPHGKCGLKYNLKFDGSFIIESLPSREVWVEIQERLFSRLKNQVTSLTGSVG